jgi:hypothetical protein
MLKHKAPSAKENKMKHKILDCLLACAIGSGLALVLIVGLTR